MAFLPGGSPCELPSKWGLRAFSTSRSCQPLWGQSKCSISLFKQSSCQWIKCQFYLPIRTHGFSLVSADFKADSFDSLNSHVPTLLCSSASDSHGHATHTSKMTSDHPNEKMTLKWNICPSCWGVPMISNPGSQTWSWEASVRFNFPLIAQIKPNESLKFNVF